MALYELKQEDVSDLLKLVSCDQLTIPASSAPRVYQLQALLRSAKPSTALDESKKRCEALEAEVRECLRVRDNALLEAGVLKRRLDELHGDESLEHADSL